MKAVFSLVIIAALAVHANGRCFPGSSNCGSYDAASSSKATRHLYQYFKPEATTDSAVNTATGVMGGVFPGSGFATADAAAVSNAFTLGNVAAADSLGGSDASAVTVGDVAAIGTADSFTSGSATTPTGFAGTVSVTNTIAGAASGLGGAGNAIGSTVSGSAADTYGAMPIAASTTTGYGESAAANNAASGTSTGGGSAGVAQNFYGDAAYAQTGSQIDTATYAPPGGAAQAAGGTIFNAAAGTDPLGKYSTSQGAASSGSSASNGGSSGVSAGGAAASGSH